MNLMTCGNVYGCQQSGTNFLSQLYNIASQCSQNSACSQYLQSVQQAKDYTEKVTDFMTNVYNDGFFGGTGKTVQGIIIGMITGAAWENAKNSMNVAVATLTSGIATSGDPQLSVSEAANGTSIQDYEGSVFVQSFATNQSVYLASGQAIFIPINQTQASQQNLSNSVVGFNSNSVPQWLIIPHSSPNSFYTIIGFALVFVVIVVAVSGVYVRRRSRVRRKARQLVPPTIARPLTSSSATQNPVPFFVPAPIRPSSAQAGRKFCKHCGHAVSSQATFCNQCGNKLS
jgi:hypothetical protein